MESLKNEVNLNASMSMSTSVPQHKTINTGIGPLGAGPPRNQSA
jgi:hypothetical protein